MDNYLTTLADLGVPFEANPGFNRLILKKVDEQRWEVTRADGLRPNNLRQIADVSHGKFSYERNAKRGFEALTGYDIDQDATYKVVYRL